jgi:riboflavin kinase / FMN adenylyltransferase
MASELPIRPAVRRATNLPEVVAGRLASCHPLRGSVLALGNFDGFHLGHQSLARMAQQLAAGRPVAVMSCEPHPRSFFGSESAPFRLATAASKRYQMAQYDVDFIYSPSFGRSFASLGPLEFVERILVEALGVQHVIAGPDFRFGIQRGGDMSQLAELGADHGFDVSIAPDIKHAGVRVSSTLIRAAVQAGDLRGATQLLGHGWIVETHRTVAGGLRLHPSLCLPRPGRYIGRATGTHGWGEPIPIDIGCDGEFAPLGPHPLRAAPEMWCLEGQVARRNLRR